MTMGDVYDGNVDCLMVNDQLIASIRENLIKGENETIFRNNQNITPASALEEGVVLVQYVDQDFKMIALENQDSGPIGLAYHFKPKEIPGFRYLEVKGKPDDVYSKKSSLVIFVYEQMKEQIQEVGTVQVMYFDLDKRNLGLSDIVTGFVGTMHQIKKKMISGYTFSHRSHELVDTFEAGTKTIYCYYKKTSDKSLILRGHVISECVDNLGNPLIKEDFQTGSLGMPYQVNLKEIPGYQYLYTKDNNARGYFGEEPTFVTNVYQPTDASQFNKEGVIFGNYIDEAGNEIARPTMYSDMTGIQFIVSPKVIPGYQLQKIEGKSKGIYHNTIRKVTFHYQKIVANSKTAKKKKTVEPVKSSQAAKDDGEQKIIQL